MYLQMSVNVFVKALVSEYDILTYIYICVCVCLEMYVYFSRVYMCMRVCVCGAH